jgi:AcrR family transcriptional regulator
LSIGSPIRPRGRTEVVEALLDAATRLFAERGPAAVSLRDVANEANVNLGLIHRYIGGKQDLVTQVLIRRPGMPPFRTEPDDSASTIADALLQLMQSDAAYFQIMLRAVLDGFDVPETEEAFPLILGTIASAPESMAREDAAMRVAFLAAAGISWRAIGPILLRVVDQAELGPDEVVETLRPSVVAFLQADPA